MILYDINKTELNWIILHIEPMKHIYFKLTYKHLFDWLDLLDVVL